ncbi:serine protease persephone-like [Teleopsis dalmanni]|uniref:serine protease persephone-like n=1 Tax=Teleopsis dalmanni TaxID=139649 RepID=UPI0018CD89F2|nr:serine protease persephone-like [Teleopsis dalmanni]
MFTKNYLYLLVLCTFLFNVVSTNNLQFSNHIAKRAATGRNIRPSERACNSFPRTNARLVLRSITRFGAPENLQHMAAIVTKNERGDGFEYKCVGTIIEKRFILTAAHCLDYLNGKETFVAVGVNNLRNLGQATRQRVKTKYIHPDYSMGINDIALLELENDLSFNSAVSPACLYTDQNIPETLTVGLWCRESAEMLFESHPKYLTENECIRSFEGVQNFLNQNSFCVNEGELCIGASGVGLVKKVNGVNYVVGVVVLGKSRGAEYVGPSIAMRVAGYLDFIENIVWSRRQ